MNTFDGKVAAITGAGSGIGRALAIALAERGAALALSDVDAAGLQETVGLLPAGAPRCTTAIVDVANRDAVFAWAEACRTEHGQVNLLFNNAGVALAAMAETARLADVEWLMNINFWGVVHGTQAFLPHLRASGDGHIVNVSSAFGLLAMPTQSAYNAAKFAVRGYTEALRMELELQRAPVSATCVMPGGIATRIVGKQRIAPDVEGFSGLDLASFRARGEHMIQRTPPPEAARQILAGVQRNARRVLVGRDARMADLLVRLLGPAYQALVIGGARQARRRAEQRRQAQA
jgi:NAD(P)-dependent dehydrogenase (short-subunit alcohol dehydrogenase family)